MVIPATQTPQAKWPLLANLSDVSATNTRFGLFGQSSRLV